jgi:hypothetical protein
MSPVFNPQTHSLSQELVIDGMASFRQFQSQVAKDAKNK